jgi:hypothetical protein
VSPIGPSHQVCGRIEQGLAEGRQPILNAWGLGREDLARDQTVWVSMCLEISGMARCSWAKRRRPAPIAKHLTAVNTTTHLGSFDGVTDIDRLTGVPLPSFRDFLLENCDGLLAAARTAK